jgi:hypothetical protein
MARAMIDYGVDGNNDLLISGGDFVRVESTAQHQRQLLLCQKGEYKDNPTICVGVSSYQDDDNKEALFQEITVQFQQDGMEVVNLEPNTRSVSDSSEKIFDNSYYK